jgi:spore germination cell wall hydrolase CwlJ-like protein
MFNIKPLVVGFFTGFFLSSSVATADVNEYQTTDIDFIKDEIECLAKNIYFETHARSLIDSVSVSDVVLNRVQDPRYPNTVCEVVYQGVRYASGAMKRNMCMFSWYCDGKSDKPKDKSAWKQSVIYATDFFLNETYRGITQGATHYHATYSNPYWSRSKDMKKIARMGVHIFYRWEN